MPTRSTRTARRAICGVVPALVVSLCTCASLEHQPTPGDQPLHPGEYWFEGEIVVEDRYHRRTQRTTELVSGSLHVRRDGSVALASTHGSCEDGRVVSGIAALNCEGVRARIGTRTGSMRVMVTEVQEVRTGRCARGMVSTVGRAVPVCLQYESDLEIVRRPRTTDLVVARVR